MVYNETGDILGCAPLSKLYAEIKKSIAANQVAPTEA
jgi:hypothetical protein